MPTSDESGTLATVAVTKRAAFLVVDSGVSSWGKLQPDPSRKLFDISKNASCALAGHLSYSPTKTSKPIFVLAAAARLWIKTHPEADVAAVLPQILQAMTNTFASELRYTQTNHLEPSRARGKDVTTLLCATYSGNAPRIYMGEISYGDDGRLTWTAGQLTPILFIAGVIPLNDLVVPSKRQSAFIDHFYPSENGKRAFSKFLLAYTSKNSADWDEEDVRRLLSPLYVRVEEDTVTEEEVGENLGVSAPNNVCVFTKQGRYSPKFEQETWVPTN